MNIKTLVLGDVQSNSYIIQDEKSGKAALIDCGECTKALLGELKKAGLENFEYILLTHGHFDHIFGVADLKQKLDIPVLIHKNDADCLHDEMKSLGFYHYAGIQKNIKADKTIKDGDVLPLGSTNIHVLHTPGHTKGSVCFMCNDFLFTGDTLFKRTVGRVDFPGGSVHELGDSIKRLFALEGDFIVYPGHNAPTTLEAERKTNRFLRNKDVFANI